MPFVNNCRFEMPYNIWCNGCGNHIGMGKHTIPINSLSFSDCPYSSLLGTKDSSKNFPSKEMGYWEKITFTKFGHEVLAEFVQILAKY